MKGKMRCFRGGCDFPMRIAVEKEFRRITGQEPDFTYSGWGAKLTKVQRYCEYNEDGDFDDAMIGDILEQVEEWSPEMLDKLIRKILSTKEGSS